MMKVDHVLAILVLVFMTLSALAEAPATAPAASQPAEVDECLSQLKEFERLLLASDGDGVRKLLLKNGDPDAEERIEEFAMVVKSGGLSSARVIPLATNLDGPVVCVMSGFVMSADDPRIELEPMLFVKRDGKWRPFYGMPAAARFIMDESEQAACKRLEKWVREWRDANRATVEELKRKQQESARDRG